MVLPYLDYGDIVNDDANLKFLKKLQTLQNQGLIICNNETGYIPTVVLHQRYKVAQLTARRTAHVRNFMYKKQICMELIDRRPINTRSHDATHYHVTQPRIERFKQNPLYMGTLEGIILMLIYETFHPITNSSIQSKEMDGNLKFPSAHGR